MRAWFRSQPIHRKLVLTSMVKTTVVLLASMILLLILDAARFQTGARTDAESMAAMVAANVRAALFFDDKPSLDATVDTVHRRREVQRLCVYDALDGLVGKFTRPEESCPPTRPGPPGRWSLAATAPVEQSGAVIGHVYVESDWTALRDRLATAGAVSLVILFLASLLMFVISHRLHRNISEPIRELAAAAEGMGNAETFQMPVINAGDDEVGQLVTAFGAMADRVRLSNVENAALLERERETNRIKDEFLATVSHELRTPLNAIVGWAHILVTSKPDEATVARAAASLHRNAQAQARVIDDLIDISRIVTGKLQVRAEHVDLRTVVDAAVDAIRPAAEHAKTTLILSMPPTVCLVEGDRDRLRQIVWNLLSNAVKFAPGGTVRVNVDDDHVGLRLTVTDDGIGIAPDFIEHVFDRFRQADSSITREHAGLGIGLAVAKELVELHHGVIRAHSQGRGTGATFVVTLPCATSAVPIEAEEERVPSLAGLSVLAVDDNPDSLDLLKAVLTDAGAEARVAGSGEQALEDWAREPADVLLCDLAMPGMSGFELLSRIREIDRRDGRVTPAIAVTAHASDEQVARSAQAGFQNHIAKPINSGDLVRAVNAARLRV